MNQIITIESQLIRERIAELESVLPQVNTATLALNEINSKLNTEFKLNFDLTKLSEQINLKAGFDNTTFSADSLGIKSSFEYLTTFILPSYIDIKTSQVKESIKKEIENEFTYRLNDNQQAIYESLNNAVEVLNKSGIPAPIRFLTTDFQGLVSVNINSLTQL